MDVYRSIRFEDDNRESDEENVEEVNEAAPKRAAKVCMHVDMDTHAIILVYVHRFRHH